MGTGERRGIMEGMPMKLYLIQHGEANPEAEDPDRSLTARGEEEVRRVATVAKYRGVVFCVGA
jgi:phosphohistidine phosphatase SixA